MFVPREWRELVQRAEQAGWRLVRGRKHNHLYGPDGRSRIRIPSTPGEGRALRNARSDFRRHGIPIPR